MFNVKGYITIRDKLAVCELLILFMKSEENTV